MAVMTISDFVEDLRSFQYPGLELSGLAGRLIENPNGFKLKNLKDRTEIKKLGRDKIPHHGTFYFNKKNFYDYQNEEDRKRYKELKNNPNALAMIERVKDFEPVGRKNIKLIIERYLVVERN